MATRPISGVSQPWPRGWRPLKSGCPTTKRMSFLTMNHPTIKRMFFHTTNTSYTKRTSFDKFSNNMRRKVRVEFVNFFTVRFNVSREIDHKSSWEFHVSASNCPLLLQLFPSLKCQISSAGSNGAVHLVNRNIECSVVYAALSKSIQYFL